MGRFDALGSLPATPNRQRSGNELFRIVERKPERLKELRAERAEAVGAWLSLVEHSVRDRGVGGSNPLAPTKICEIWPVFLRDFRPFVSRTLPETGRSRFSWLWMSTF